MGEIKTALDMSPPDLATAKDIYTASILHDWALDDVASGELEKPNEVLAAYIKFFGDDPKWQDTYIDAAFDGIGDFEGSSELVRAHAALGGIWGLHFHEIDMELHESEVMLEEGDEHATHLDDGAPSHLDEAWAILASDVSPGNSLYDMATMLAAEMGTRLKDQDCQAETVVSITKAFNEAKTAAGAGDAAAFKTAHEDIEEHLIVIYLQASRAWRL